MELSLQYYIKIVLREGKFYEVLCYPSQEAPPVLEEEDDVVLEDAEVSFLGKDKFSKLLLSGEGRKVNKLSGPPACTYRLRMHCTSRNTTNVVKLQLGKHPLTVQHLQEAIEYDYNVPMSTQELHYKSSILSSREFISAHGIKDGDMLTVWFTFSLIPRPSPLPTTSDQRLEVVKALE